MAKNNAFPGIDHSTPRVNGTRCFSGRRQALKLNPASAVEEFLREDTRFVAEEPPFAFNEGLVTERVTYWPGGFLKRVL